jgi:hypothetical protein
MIFMSSVEGPMPDRLNCILCVLVFILCCNDAAKGACVGGDVFCSDQYVFSRNLLQSLSCDELWTLRNSILNEHGFCFPTRKEAETFNNADCTVDTLSKLNLNSNNRDNLKRLAAMEWTKLCIK